MLAPVGKGEMKQALLNPELLMKTPQTIAESTKGHRPIRSYKEPPWALHDHGLSEWITPMDQTASPIYNCA